MGMARRSLTAFSLGAAVCVLCVRRVDGGAGTFVNGKHIDDGLFDPQEFWWVHFGEAYNNSLAARKESEKMKLRKQKWLKSHHAQIELGMALQGVQSDDVGAVSALVTATANSSSSTAEDEEEGDDFARRVLHDDPVDTSECNPDDFDEKCCIRCKQGADDALCRVLGGKVIEDKYYPTESGIRGSCDNFEDQAARLDIFGPERTFRDTPQCRAMVYDYVCYFWGSQNRQFDNKCAALSEFSANDYVLRPCTSFCNQISTACANRNEWGRLCYNLKCPPYAETCTPFSRFVPEDVDPAQACEIYEYSTPEDARDAATRGAGGATGATAAGAALLVGALLLARLPPPL